MTRVVILTSGSQGDVRPYIALGLGLLRAGYQVRLGAPETYRTLITSLNLDFCEVPRETQTKSEKDGTSGHHNGKLTLPWALTIAPFNPFRTIYRLLRLQKQSEHAMRIILESTWIACQGADCIIGSYLTLGGLHVAERMRIPYLWALIYPAGQTKEFPYFLAPHKLRLGPYYNCLTHLVGEQLFWQLQRPVIDGWRNGSLGLSRLGFSSPYSFTRRHTPVLYGYSSALAPKAPEWGDHMQVVGPWFLHMDRGWQPPKDLVSFLQSVDDPPVSIGFGSVPDIRSNDLVTMACEALVSANRRGVVLTGDFHGAGGLLSDRVYVLNWAPHDWLFPQMCAVVHHAGVGTTAEGLRWGLPTVTAPQHADQWFWARRVAEAGAGPVPIPRHALSTSNLAEAIRIATIDPKMQAAARKLGHAIAAEDGVQRVVEIVRKLRPAQGDISDRC
jgi:sterol 3beta-glucosyltransferase